VASGFRNDHYDIPINVWMARAWQGCRLKHWRAVRPWPNKFALEINAGLKIAVWAGYGTIALRRKFNVQRHTALATFRTGR